MSHKAKMDLKLKEYTPFEEVFTPSRNFNAFFNMFCNVREGKNGLMGYVISSARCCLNFKKKFEPFLKKCSRMCQKAEMDLKVT